MTEIVAWSTDSGWQGSTSVTVPAGTQAGDLLQIFLTRNSAPEVSPPAGWDLVPEGTMVEGDLGEGAAVFLYERVATAADEAEPTYTWGWPTQHNSSAILLVFRDPLPRRAVGIAVRGDDSTNILASPSLEAVEGDFLALYGWNWSTSAGSEPEFVGLTTLVNSGTLSVAAPDVIEADGPTEEYELTSTANGRMAVVGVLFEGEEPEPEPEPQLVWQNTFDGGSGAVTVANSTNYGDAVSIVGGSVSYSANQKAQGSGALQLGSTDTNNSGNVEIDFEVGQDIYWGLRFYLYVPVGGYVTVDLGSATAGESVILTIDDDTDQYNIFGIDVSADAANLVNSWLRVYVTQSVLGSFSSRSVSIRWSQPDTGTWDLVRSQTDGNFVGGETYIRFSGGGFVTPPSYVDSVAVWDDIQSAAGALPAPYEPSSEVLVQNTLDGPTGVQVSVSNTGDYGTPATSVLGSATTYSDEWSAAGPTSVRVTTAASMVTWTNFVHPSQFALRAYVYVPEGTGIGIAAGTQSFFAFNNVTESYSWAGVDLGPQLSQVVGSTLRVEILRVDFTATLRLWWVDPHGPVSDPDFEVSVDTSTWDAVASLSFAGVQNSFGAFFDEVVLQGAGAGWVGPVAFGGVVEAGVTFVGEAVGTTDVGGFVSHDVEYGSAVEGSKTVTADVTAQVAYSGEVEHDARETGLAVHDVSYGAEIEGTVLRDDAIEAAVEYSGEVEWLTERSSGGDADVVYSGGVQGESRVTLPDVTRVGLRYRLVVYDPNGAMRGQIPLPLNFTVGVPLNDLPSLSLEYLRSAPGYEYLDRYCEVAVELAALNSSAYIEYPGMRFINIRSQGDSTDRTGNMKYTMPHYGWQLRKARIITGLNVEEQRSFTNATFGSILHTLLIEAQGRGWNPGMSWDFTPQRDSAGRVWDDVYTINFDAGQDLWTILETFAQQNACDFQFHRRVLRIFNTDTSLNRDRTDQAVLQLGRDITSAPNDWSSEELAARVHVRGDDLRAITMLVPNAQQPWGAWETYIKQSGVTDYATLNRLGSWALEKARQPLVQMTRGILFPTAEYIPFRDYQPGDYITAPGDVDGPFADLSQNDLRVQQVTLVSVDSQGMEGALVLNERFIENSLRRDRILNALTGGAGSNPGGGGGGTPPREDTRSPRAPEGLVVGSDTYINEIGEPRGQITATWAPVTHATNNTEMDVRAYEVYVRWAAAGETFSLRTTVDHPDTTAFMGPYNPDEVYEVRVRAVGRNQRRSAFSVTVPVFVDRDAQAPDIPSIPLLESRLGVVRVTWDGQSIFGTPMDLDFDYVAVWMSETASEDDGWERVDTLYRQGVSVIPGLDYDTEYYFRFSAVDRSNNESEFSEIASISVQQLVPTDITPGSIGYELLAEGAVRDDILADDAVRNRHVAAGEITGEKIRAFSIFADRIAVGNTRNLVVDPKHTDEDLNQLRLDNAGGAWAYNYDEYNQQDAPYVWRADNPNGLYRFYWVQSVEAEGLMDPHGYIPVAAEMGRLVSTARVTVGGRTSGTATVGMYVRYLDRSGNLLPEQLAVVAPVTFETNVTNAEITSSNGAEVPEEAAYALLYALVTLTGANDNLWVRVSRPFAALTNGQVLIENGAISANKIAANAITADKIDVGAVTAVAIAADAITTDKLAANAITAKHTITGALVQTTAQANRGLKISSTGMRGYDSVGNQTLFYSSSTGNVTVTGTYQSGISGSNRVLVSSTATWSSNPGVSLRSGGSGARDSNYFMSVPGDGSDFSNYATIITGSEAVRNSSGRSDLVLQHGGTGGAYLRYQWGNRGSVGFRYEDWDVFVRGRVTSAQSAYDTHLWARSGLGSGSGGYTSWTFTYGTSAPNGGRMVMLSGHTNLTSNQIVETSVSAQNLGNFFAVSRTTGSYRVQYWSTWVDQNV